MKKQYSIGKPKSLPESEVEWEGEIEASLLESEFEKSLRKIAENAELPGFRKGKAPHDMVLKKIGDMTILDDAAESVLDLTYADMVSELKLRVIGRPKVTITKIARNSSLGFRITVPVLPEIKLPNYKSIAKEIMSESDDLTITDEEVEKIIMEVRKHHYHTEQHKSGAWTDHEHGEIKDGDIPPLTDELAKKFGQFDDIADMKKKIRQNMEQEKITKAKEKKRAGVIEKIISETDFEVPRVLVENELDTMMAQFEGDISRSGLTLEDYLGHIKKTSDDLRGEWKETAVKKAKAQMILSTISEKENIIADPEMIRTETEKLMIAYPGADVVRARSFVAMHLTNEQIFSFFEKQSTKEK